MDLSVSGPVTQIDRFEVATTLQSQILNFIFHSTNWKAPRAVLHGGTSLSLMRKSDRFSEDLDFMVDESAYAELDAIVAKTFKKVSEQTLVRYPGCAIELYGPKGEEVRAWDFRWSHPSRRGKIVVKIEFLKTTTDLLKNYRTAHILPTANGSAIVSITTAIPTPELVAAWADKVKAIATRPEFKWRDAYDLAFLHDQFHGRGWKKQSIDDDALYDALASTAAIYDKTPGDLIHGLEGAIERNVFDDIDAFAADMSRWLNPERWEEYNSLGMFSDMLGKARHEIERALEIVIAVDRSPSGMQP